MKVILYMAITANGYIARENDDTPWSDEEWEAFNKMANHVKNEVIGRKTLELFNEKGIEAMGNPFIVVLTSQKGAKSNKNIKFVNTPQEALELLERQGFKEALVAGGSTLNTSFMKEELVDEIYLDVEPFVFSKGVPLFRPEDFEYKLELLEVNKLSSQTIQLHYKVIK
jgi:dihydrofolate reductase